jgi:hypothetical protein
MARLADRPNQTSNLASAGAAVRSRLEARANRGDARIAEFDRRPRASLRPTSKQAQTIRSRVPRLRAWPVDEQP